MAVPPPVARPPSGWWYLVPVLGAVVALVASVGVVRDGFDRARQVALDANLTSAGRSQVVTITEPGGYTIAYYGERVVTSDAEKEELAERLRITVIPAEGLAEPLEVRTYEGFQDQLGTDGLQYVPLRTVRFEERGDYLVRTAPQPGLDAERTLIVVTESPFRQLRDAARTALVVLVLGTFLVVLVTVIVARARGRARRAAGPPRPPWPGGPGAPPGWPPPGPGWGPPGPPPGAVAPPGWPPPGAPR